MSKYKMKNYTKKGAIGDRMLLEYKIRLHCLGIWRRDNERKLDFVKKHLKNDKLIQTNFVVVKCPRCNTLFWKRIWMADRDCECSEFGTRLQLKVDDKSIDFPI